jgi:hypothetical protein
MLSPQTTRLTMRIRSAKIVSIMAMAAMALTGCDAGPVSFDALKPGEMQPARSLIDKDFHHLCTLAPYQGRLHDPSSFRDRINAHLSETGYRGDEGTWAIVLVRSADIEVLTFKRSARLDLADASMAGAAQMSRLPGNFEPVSCVDADIAAFAKITGNDRIYIILGKSTQ